MALESFDHLLLTELVPSANGDELGRSDLLAQAGFSNSLLVVVVRGQLRVRQATSARGVINPARSVLLLALLSLRIGDGCVDQVTR